MLYDPKWEKPAVDAVGQILLLAAELIESRGHAKNALCDNDGRLCMGGAINVATGKAPGEMGGEAASAPKERMRKHLGRSYVDFNNDPKTTKADVIAALRAAAS